MKPTTTSVITRAYKTAKRRRMDALHTQARKTLRELYAQLGTQHVTFPIINYKHY